MADLVVLHEEIPIIHIPGIFLFPRTSVRLRFKTPYEKSIFEASLSKSRMFGIVQPTLSSSTERWEKVGVGVQIVSFSEVDGFNGLEFDILVHGIQRFEILSERMESGINYAHIAWSKYSDDFRFTNEKVVGRDVIEPLLRNHFRKMGVMFHFPSFENLDDTSWVNSFALACSINLNHKQRLLESVDIADRAGLLAEILCLEDSSVDITKRKFSV